MDAVTAVILLVVFEQALQLWAGLAKWGVFHDISGLGLVFRVVLAVVILGIWSPYIQEGALVAVLLTAGVLSQSISIVIRRGVNDYFKVPLVGYYFNLADVYLLAGFLLYFTAR